MKKINKYLILCFVLAFITLLITSKNSFLYVFNDWVDANAFFTVGKSMFNKIIPYKDLFEQKGPLLYLIYGLGYVLSHKTFHGVFIIEVISFTVFLYYIHKLFNIYFNKKYSIVLLPIISVVITTSAYFVHGGSCEEFCFPFIAVSLYYFNKHFKEKELTNKEILINGLMAGSVLMMKYTMLGFWIGFGAFIAINYLIKKEYKKMFKFCYIFLLGMSIPFILGIIYFLINGGVKEFIDVYFRLNMTSYTNNEKYGLIRKVIEIFKYMFKEYSHFKSLGLLIILSVLTGLIKTKNRVFNLSLVGLTFILNFFMAWGFKAFIYYYLPILVLTVIALTVFIMNIIKKYTDKIIDKKNILILLIPFFILTTLATYKFCNYKEYIKKTKEDFIQYKYAKYINKYENPTLLNMGFLDIGLYTTTGIIPNTRFFEVQNFDYEKFRDNLDEMERYVKEKQIKFIVYAKNGEDTLAPEYIYENYEEIYKDNYIFEGSTYTSYLFKLKEINE